MIVRRGSCLMYEHQLPDYAYVKGYSEVLPGLFIAGEDDVDRLLYGEEEARHFNNHFTFATKPVPQIDCWIDLRDSRDSNRKVYVPDSVQKVDFPFKDGNVEEARAVIPQALACLTDCMAQGKRVLVSCHEGKSRSCLLVLLYLKTKMQAFEAEMLMQQKRPIASIDKRFKSWLSETH